MFDQGDGEVRGWLEPLEREALGAVPPSALGDDMLQLLALADRVQVEAMRRLRAFDARLGWSVDGDVSCTAWLRRRRRLAGPTAAGLVGLAEALDAMPATAAAVVNGSLSLDQARVLATARTPATQDALAEHEAGLVEAALPLAPRQIRHLVAHWKHLVDWAAAERDANEAHDHRRLHLSVTYRGRVVVHGELDAEGGAIVATAVRNVAEDLADGPHDAARTAAQRRADALVELCRRHLDGVSSGGQPRRPHLTLTVPASSLEPAEPTGVAGLARLDDGEPLSPPTVRRLACDAVVTRVVTGGRSQPLDVGRLTRIVPTGLRRALVVRDGGCAFPGCDRPPDWTDAHHVVHWADGGATSLANLVLLCRRHHRLVHHDGFTVEAQLGAAFSFRRPDGDVLAAHPPPLTATG